MKGNNLALFEGTLGRVLQSKGFRNDGDENDGDVGTDESSSSILGGGQSRISMSGDAASVGAAIDPTNFYRYLSSSNGTPFDTDNVGDAAMVFQSSICLLNIRCVIFVLPSARPFWSVPVPIRGTPRD